MAERKSFLLRIDGDVLDGVRRWADGDLRSLNGQVEFLLRKALRDTGRLGREKSGEGPREPGDSQQETD
jgi:hypothetical protein